MIRGWDRRSWALVWLVVVAVLCAHLGWRFYQGITFRTDLMALLPRDEGDPGLQQANDSVARALSRRVVVLVGNPDPARAQAAAGVMARTLADTGLVAFDADQFDRDRLTALGARYFAYRQGLLSEDDRAALLAGDASALSRRAMSQVFGFVGMADARLLRRDPFLLLPAFFTSLPLPQTNLATGNGLPEVRADGMDWVLLSGRLEGEPFELDVQNRLADAYAAATGKLRTEDPRTEMLHLGAVFFAHAGAKTALSEMSTLGTVSLVGTVVLLVAVFRAVRPLLLSLLAVGVGMAGGLSVSLLVFGQLHVAALLLGLSLIGIAVDYSLYFCAERFAPGAATPAQRLRRVMPGISLGLVTTVIGYATLLLAPFPGLRQVAVFSVVGLLGSFLTVVCWLPLLDERRPLGHGGRMLRVMATAWQVHVAPGWRAARILAFAVLLGGMAIGLARLAADDDVRRMQSLAPDLVREQAQLQGIIGLSAGTQFFVVRAPDEETVLRWEEALLERLHGLKGTGALAAYRAPASFVPSAERQRENRTLRRDRLETPLLAQHLATLGLSGVELEQQEAGFLTLPMLTGSGPLAPLLAGLMIDAPGDPPAERAHVVMLDGVIRTDLVAAAAEGMEGVRFVDPVADFSRLLGRYRVRAAVLIGVSALLMVPLLALRYGWRGAVRVMLPPALAVCAVPALKALFGAPFTFFDAMGLVLVLSVAVDYAVFCAESDVAHRPVTLLAVGMAMVSTLLSFGLLAFSQVAAVHAFGSTMLLGVVLGFVLAPMAGPARGAS